MTLRSVCKSPVSQGGRGRNCAATALRIMSSGEIERLQVEDEGQVGVGGLHAVLRDEAVRLAAVMRLVVEDMHVEDPALLGALPLRCPTVPGEVSRERLLVECGGPGLDP